jgi:hypothetical protein
MAKGEAGRTAQRPRGTKASQQNACKRDHYLTKTMAKSNKETTKLDPLLVKNLVQDIEASGKTLVEFNLAAHLEDRSSTYGDVGSDKRRAVQQKFHALKVKSATSYLKFLDKRNVAPGAGLKREIREIEQAKEDKEDKDKDNDNKKEDKEAGRSLACAVMCVISFICCLLVSFKCKEEDEEDEDSDDSSSSSESSESRKTRRSTRSRKSTRSTRSNRSK